MQQVLPGQPMAVSPAICCFCIQKRSQFSFSGKDNHKRMKGGISLVQQKSKETSIALKLVKHLQEKNFINMCRNEQMFSWTMLCLLCHTDNRSNKWNTTTVIYLKCTHVFVIFKIYWFFMVIQNHLPKIITDSCDALFRFKNKTKQNNIVGIFFPVL